MANNKKGERKRRLADMTIRPEATARYCQPPADECEETEWPVSLPTVGQKLIVRTMWSGDRIVEFAIMQMVLDDGGWVCVARIDTANGVIHRHQFVWSTGRDIWDHRPIAAIPADGYDVIADGYDNALSAMENEWQENYRRWRDDCSA
jgi:hypothetical protein